MDELEAAERIEVVGKVPAARRDMAREEDEKRTHGVALDEEASAHAFTAGEAGSSREQGRQELAEKPRVIGARFPARGGPGGEIRQTPPDVRAVEQAFTPCGVSR